MRMNLMMSFTKIMQTVEKNCLVSKKGKVTGIFSGINTSRWTVAYACSQISGKHWNVLSLSYMEDGTKMTWKSCLLNPRRKSLNFPSCMYYSHWWHRPRWGCILLIANVLAGIQGLGNFCNMKNKVFLCREQCSVCGHWCWDAELFYSTYGSFSAGTSDCSVWSFVFPFQGYRRHRGGLSQLTRGTQTTTQAWLRTVRRSQSR